MLASLAGCCPDPDPIGFQAYVDYLYVYVDATQAPAGEYRMTFEGEGHWVTCVEYLGGDSTPQCDDFDSKWSRPHDMNDEFERTVFMESWGWLPRELRVVLEREGEVYLDEEPVLDYQLYEPECKGAHKAEVFLTVPAEPLASDRADRRDARAWGPPPGG